MASSQSPYSNVANEVHNALDELNADESQYIPSHPSGGGREAEELFLLPDCVHIFFVTGSGKVSTFSEPSTLRIFRFKDDSTNQNPSDATTFIQVGGWTHPLIPGKSPVLEAGNGAFMFPDVYEDKNQEGEPSAVGIIIADDTPFNIEGEAQTALEKILGELTEGSLKKEEPLSKDQRLGTVARTLVKGAELMSYGMEKGAEKATTLIEYAGEKQRAKTEPTAEDTKISPAYKATAKGAMYATLATVKVSGFVAKRVGSLSKGVSNYLAKKLEDPVVNATGGSGGESKMKSSSSMRQIANAAYGGLLAYGTVYDGLEKSSKILGSSLKKESVQVVEHQYGKEAAVVTTDSMSAAGNAAMTYLNVQSLGAKGLAKKTAKNTGKTLAKNVIQSHVGTNDKSNLQEKPQ
jgi:spartin